MKIKLNWIKWLSNASYTRHKLIVSTLLTCVHDFTPPLSPQDLHVGDNISDFNSNKSICLLKEICMQYKSKWTDWHIFFYTQYFFYYNSIHRMWGKTCLSWLDRCTAMRIPRSGLDLEISTYPPLKTRRKVPGKRFSTSCF